jgi:hypothetical protein
MKTRANPSVVRVEREDARTIDEECETSAECCTGLRCVRMVTGGSGLDGGTSRRLCM